MSKKKLTPEEIEYAKYLKAINVVFKGNADSMLASLIKDFTPKEGKEKKLSIGSILKAIGFAIRHPWTTRYLVKFALSKPPAYLSQKFQEALLREPKFWEKVKKHAGGLPVIGKILAGFNVKMFQEDKASILNQNALKRIGGALGNDATLKEVQNIAVKAVRPGADWKEITSDGLKLISGDNNLKLYLKENGQNIRHYVTDILVGVDSKKAGEIIKGLATKPEYSDIAKSLEEPEEGKNIFAEGLADYLVKKVKNADDPSKLESIKGYDMLVPGAKEALQKLSEEAVSALTPPLQKAYGLDGNRMGALTELIPISLDSPESLEKIFQAFARDDYTEMVKELLQTIEAKPEIVDYFKKNRNQFVEVLDKAFSSEDAPLKGKNLKGELYDLVPDLLGHPNELVRIVEAQEKGNFADIGKIFLDITGSDKAIQNYFKDKGGLLASIGIKSANLEAYGVKENIGELLGILTNEKNKDKMKELVNLYGRKDWLGLVKTSCRFMAEDPEFNRYMKENRENFAKIVTYAIERTPLLQKYLGGASDKIGDLVGKIISDPKSVSDLLSSEGKLQAAYRGTKFLLGKAFDREFLGILYGAAKGLVFGEEGGKDKEKVAAGFLSVISQKDKSGTKAPFKALIEECLNSLGLPEQEFKNLKNIIDKNKLFFGISVKGSKNAPLNLGNLSLEGVSFVNSKLADVSFEGSSFVKTAFDGASFKNVSFKGAELDSDSFKSLLPFIKDKKISTEGMKITGDLSRLDLSDLDLSKADLSKVTSLKDSNIKNTILPANLSPGLLKNTINLEDAKGLPLDKETISAQREYVLEKIKILAQKQENAVQEKDLSFLRNSGIIADKVRKDAQSDHAIINGNYEKIEKPQNINDYSGKISDDLSAISSRDSFFVKAVDRLAINFLSDRVAHNLFGPEGKNRGEDGLIIRKLVREALKALPDLDIAPFLSSEESKNLEAVLTKEIKARTKYTKAGLLTGGIYLPKDAGTDKKLQEKMKEEVRLCVKGFVKEAEKIIDSLNKHDKSKPKGTKVIKPDRGSMSKKIIERPNNNRKSIEI